jgi:molecular chaperone GrpE
MKQAKKVVREDIQIDAQDSAQNENQDSVNVNATQNELPAEEELEETPLDMAQKSLSELQDKYNQLNDVYLRNLAEFDNYRKRSLKEKVDLIKNGGEKVLVDLLNVVDDMERGLAATKDAQDIQAIKEGFDLIYSKMQTFLKQNNVVPMDAVGKAFDTDNHEAITTFPAPTEDLKGKVVDCVQKGYTLNEKVIRFAKVVVGE